MKLSQKYMLFPISALLLVVGCGGDSSNAAANAVEAMNRGDYSNAAKQINRAGKNAERTSEYYYNLGVAKARGGDLADAEKAFGAAHRLDLSNIDALEYKAFVLREMGDGRSAHEAYDMAIARASDLTAKVRIMNALAVTEHMLGHDDVAVIRLNHAAVIAPKYAPTYLNKAKVFGDMLGLYGEALKAIETFESVLPSDAEGAQELRQKALAYKTTAKGLVEETAPATAHRNSATLDRLLKQANEALGRRKLDLAEEVFNKAVTEDPKSYEAAYKLAETRYAAKKYDMAAVMYAKAAELDSSAIDPVYKQALIAYTIGDNAKALDILTHKAMPRWPEFIEFYRIASYAYCVQKRHYEARVCGEAFMDICKSKGTDISAFKTWYDTIPQVAMQLD